MTLFGNFETFKQSISFKILKVVFTIYFVITAIVTVLHIVAQYKKEQYQLTDELRLFSSTFSDPLSESIWKLNDKQVLSTIKGLMKNHKIIGVKIVPIQNQHSPVWTTGITIDNEGQKRISENTSEEKLKYFSTRFIQESFEIKYTDHSFTPAIIEKVADGYIYSSQNIIYNELQLSILFIIINAIIKTLTLWWLFYKCLKYFITAPLNEVTTHMKHVSLKHIQPLQVNNQIYQYELRVLQQAFNFFLNELKKQISIENYKKSLLRNSEHFLQNLYNSIDTPLIGVKDTHTIHHWNKASEILFNVEHSEFNLEKTSVLSEFCKTIGQDIRTAQNTQTIIEINNQTFPASKPHQRYRVYIYPSSITQSYSIIQIDDITNILKLQKNLSKKEKISSLGTLSAGMAHEINNPLAAIMQSNQNIARRLDPSLASNKNLAEELGTSMEKICDYMYKSQVTEYFHDISTEGARVSSMIKSLMDFSSKVDTKLQESELLPIIEQSLEIVASINSTKKPLIILKLKNELPKIMCAPSQLEVVFVNLIHNCLDAFENMDMPERAKIDIELETKKEFIHITLQDNGCGMTPEIKDKMFEPFFTTRKYKTNVGLGLASVYYIISEKHHGHISVTSAPNKGTCVTIKLPIQS